MTYDKKSLLKMIKDCKVLNEFTPFHVDRINDIICQIDTTKYNYGYGATKLVLIAIDGDYAIKIPYTGSYYQEDGFYDSNDYYQEGEYEYEEFFGADDDGSPWDYCLNEVLRYSIAEEEGLADCFARTSFLGYVEGYPIYIQEKAKPLCSCREEHRYSEKEKNKTSKICKNANSIDKNWLTDFRFFYGENMLIHFIKFINEMGWQSDLRDENIGYIGDRPVLIDYADFNA